MNDSTKGSAEAQNIRRRAIVHTQKAFHGHSHREKQVRAASQVKEVEAAPKNQVEISQFNYSRINSTR